MDIERLKELEAKATPAPWSIGRTDMTSYDAITGWEIHYLYRGDAETAESRTRFNCYPDSEARPRDDAALCAELRNSLPAIIARLERAETDVTDRERQMWRSALAGLLLSADASWRENNQGHDWNQACERAEATIAFFSVPVCEQCKTSHTDLNANWRWNGRAWEHRCSDCHPQVGYWEVKAAIGAGVGE